MVLSQTNVSSNVGKSTPTTSQNNNSKPKTGSSDEKFEAAVKASYEKAGRLNEYTPSGGATIVVEKPTTRTGGSSFYGQATPVESVGEQYSKSQTTPSEAFKPTDVKQTITGTSGYGPLRPEIISQLNQTQNQTLVRRNIEAEKNVSNIINPEQRLAEKQIPISQARQKLQDVTKVLIREEPKPEVKPTIIERVKQANVDINKKLGTENLDMTKNVLEYAKSLESKQQLATRKQGYGEAVKSQVYGFSALGTAVGGGVLSVYEHPIQTAKGVFEFGKQVVTFKPQYEFGEALKSTPAETIGTMVGQSIALGKITPYIPAKLKFVKEGYLSPVKEAKLGPLKYETFQVITKEGVTSKVKVPSYERVKVDVLNPKLEKVKTTTPEYTINEFGEKEFSGKRYDPYAEAVDSKGFMLSEAEIKAQAKPSTTKEYLVTTDSYGARLEKVKGYKYERTTKPETFNVKTFGLQAGTKATPLLTKTPEGLKVLTSEFLVGSEYVNTLPYPKNKALFENALSGEVAKDIYGFKPEERARVEFAKKEFLLGRTEKGLPVKDYLVNIKNIPDIATAEKITPVVKEYTQAIKGEYKGTFTNIQLPKAGETRFETSFGKELTTTKNYQSIKPADIDVSSHFGIQKIREVSEPYAKKLSEASGLDIIFKPEENAFYIGKEKFIEVKSKSEQSLLGLGDEAAATLFSKKLEQRPVSFGKEKATRAGEQYSNKLAGSLISSKGEVGETASFSEPGLLGKQGSNVRGLKDVAGSFQSGLGIVEIKARKTNPLEWYKARELKKAIEGRLETYTPEQRADIKSKIKEMTGNELILEQPKTKTPSEFSFEKSKIVSSEFKVKESKTISEELKKEKKSESPEFKPDKNLSGFYKSPGFSERPSQVSERISPSGYSVKSLQSMSSRSSFSPSPRSPSLSTSPSPSLSPSVSPSRSPSQSPSPSSQKLFKTPSLFKASLDNKNIGEGSFIVEIGRKGKTKVYEQKAFAGRYEAESYLKQKLKGSIAASGTIKTSSGQSVEVNLGEEFTTSKKEKGRVVQKAKYRLSSIGEKQQIKSFKI